MSYKKIILSLAVAIGLVFAVVPAQPAAALFDNSTDQACQGVGLGTNGCDGGAKGLNGFISAALNILSAVIGIGAVVMLMVGGFKYITAGGDSSKAGNARSTIMYAIIGLVIVVIAQVIVKFVVRTTTDATKTSLVQMVERPGKA